MGIAPRSCVRMSQDQAPCPRHPTYRSPRRKEKSKHCEGRHLWRHPVVLSLVHAQQPPTTSVQMFSLLQKRDFAAAKHGQIIAAFLLNDSIRCNISCLLIQMFSWHISLDMGIKSSNINIPGVSKYLGN